MKLDIPVPFERLAWFREKLGLEDEHMNRLGGFRETFLAEKDRFADSLFQYFFEIPETRTILDHEKRSRELKRVWAYWYELLFKGSFTAEMLTYLWRSGVRHVEINLDKRFINLAYAFIRKFLQDVGRTLDNSQHEHVFVAVDRLIDFCLLTETHAYVTAISQCDIEVVKGLSHQVRNPLTIIGGNILRLQRKIKPGSPVSRTYETILMENRRLENMVRDAGVYSELFQLEPILADVRLETAILLALKKLQGMKEMKTARIQVKLDPAFPHVQGDSTALETMFYYLLQNSLEALDPMNPVIIISSGVADTEEAYTQVEIFNTGKSPDSEELLNAFVPFYSTKPHGTGFGLAIAQIVARKSLGDVLLESVPGEGTRCIVRLPIRHSLREEL